MSAQQQQGQQHKKQQQQQGWSPQDHQFSLSGKCIQQCGNDAIHRTSTGAGVCPECHAAMFGSFNK